MRRMASSTDQLVTTNPDLPRQSSVCSLSTLLAAEPSKSITMDDDDDLLLLKSIYSEPKTMDDVWKEMVTGTTTEPQHQNNSNYSEMTLEDFLSNSKALPVGLPVMDHDVSTNGSEQPVVGVSQPHEAQAQGGRGKRRRGAGGAAMAVAVEEAVVDKATLQKQRRMIKNRESAARSRERKQAYTVELEAMAVHLEEEHARLLREEADRNRQRYKQLMECLIPVTEKRKPRRKLLRVNSVQW